MSEHSKEHIDKDGVNWKHVAITVIVVLLTLLIGQEYRVNRHYKSANFQKDRAENIDSLYHSVNKELTDCRKSIETDTLEIQRLSEINKVLQNKASKRFYPPIMPMTELQPKEIDEAVREKLNLLYNRKQ